MVEERLMILKMIQDGKITPEQGASLLKALPNDPAEDPEPSSSSAAPPPGSYADLQGRLADVQVKLGELQSKLSAVSSAQPRPAQSSRWGQGVSFGLGDFNVTEVIDEAVRGVNSLKSESVKTFKLAARAAQKEGRKIRKEAKRTGKSLGIDFSLNFAESGRPRNTLLEPEHTTSEDVLLNLLEGRELKIINRLGDIKISSSTGISPHLKFKRTVWSSNTEKLRRLDAYRPAITADDAGFVDQIAVDADGPDVDNVTIDIELNIPDTIVSNVESTFGNVLCEGRSNGSGKIETQTGDVRLLSIRGDAASEGNIYTRCGVISISHWDGPTLVAETVSGDILSDGLAGKSLTVRSRSGEVALSNLQLSQDLLIESSSGDVQVSGSSVGHALSITSQSGDITVKKVRTAGTKLESVSGQLIGSEVNATDGAITMETVSGDIEVSESISAELTSVSISGSIELSFRTPFVGILTARSISSEIELELAPGADARVELTTQTGSIQTILPLDGRTDNGSRYVSGTLGKGLGSINLQTVSGDISLKPWL